MTHTIKLTAHQGHTPQHWQCTKDAHHKTDISSRTHTHTHTHTHHNAGSSSITHTTILTAHQGHTYHNTDSSSRTHITQHWQLIKNTHTTTLTAHQEHAAQQWHLDNNKVHNSWQFGHLINDIHHNILSIKTVLLSPIITRQLILRCLASEASATTKGDNVLAISGILWWHDINQKIKLTIPFLGYCCWGVL